jgi:hypothetical protein
MKKLFLLSAISLATIQAFAINVVTVQDSIATDTHWTCDNQYLLKGYVYVTAGHTLTIDAGVIVKGDKDTKGSLIVERNAKIFANGTLANPVVFTSNQDPGDRTYGDWGGVILCGNAPTNWNGGQSQVEGGPRSLYGGTDPHDNSGKLSYVRIEFAGIAFSPNNEINGLTFCSVGDATQIDHIQVSYSGDDSYEWFGGTVNTKYIVAYRGWDDDFDTDNGYSGKNQFCFGLRDPYAADQSGSKGFESDSYQSGTATGLGGDTSQITKPVFSNCTMIGPMISPGSTAWDPQFVSGAHIRRGSAISILNSVLAGWPCGVLVDQSSASFGSTTANIANGIMQFQHNIIAGTANNSTPNPKDVVFVIDGARSLTPTTANGDTTTGNPFSPFAGPWTWLTNSAYGNKTYPTEQTGVRLGDPFGLDNPNPVPTSTSPICYNAAHAFNPQNPLNPDTTGNYANYNMPAFAPDFTTNKSSDPFFDKVNFVGAFSGTGTTSDNWMHGWCNFDPVNTDYSGVCQGAVVKNVNNSFQTEVVRPNPACQTATVAFVVNNKTNMHVYMTDITGKVVKEIFNGEATEGPQSYQIDLSKVPAGLYMISIATDSKQKTLKLSVVK